MTIADIDFAALYREHMARAGRPKPPEAWDARADDMNKAGHESAYVREFIGRMDFSGCSSLLDVGCGTGAIALAAAPRLREVIGLDYSPRMLEHFLNNARAQGFAHARPIRRAWEEDWSDIPECDIVVASRSTAVMDMGAALAKLNAKARRRVYLTSLAQGRFIDQRILSAIGRPPLPPLADYIYIINILYGMGMQPRLDYIVHDSRINGATDFEDLARMVGCVLGELAPFEMERLRAWFDAGPEQALRGGEPYRWAFVSWDVR